MNKNKNLLKRNGIWYFKKMENGREVRQSLDTSDIVLARARRSVLAKKMAGEKWAEIDGLKAPASVATIGKVLELYAAASQLQLNPRTVQDNAWALRHMVRQVRGMADAAAVDALPASALTAELVRAWQQRCLSAVGSDKIKRDSAAVSANSVLVQARSVFGRRVTAHQVYSAITLPDLSGFLTTPKLQVLKRDEYHKPEDEVLRKLWSHAGRLREDQWVECSKQTELGVRATAEARGKLWLVFYLASMTGLRRSELIHLRWRWFVRDGEAHYLRTMFETDFVPKGKRERDVPVTAAVEQECRKLALGFNWPMKPGDFVLPGSLTQKEDVFRDLGEWMKACGWQRRQKAHELRKVFASDFTEQGDAYDTQLALGHQDIKTTMRYAARRKTAPVDQASRYAAPAAVTG